jgi:hypothetical protein
MGYTTRQKGYRDVQCIDLGDSDIWLSISTQLVIVVVALDIGNFSFQSMSKATTAIAMS